MKDRLRDCLLRSAVAIGESAGYISIECGPCTGSGSVQLDDELLEAIGMKPGNRCPVCIGFGVLFHDPQTNEPKDAFGLLENLGITMALGPLPGERGSAVARDPSAT